MILGETIFQYIYVYLNASKLTVSFLLKILVTRGHEMQNRKYFIEITMPIYTFITLHLIILSLKYQKKIAVS